MHGSITSLSPIWGNEQQLGAKSKDSGQKRAKIRGKYHTGPKDNSLWLLNWTTDADMRQNQGLGYVARFENRS